MKNNRKTYKVTLVGAGPGAIDLITVKGLNAIKSADIIFYDALVNKALLKNAKPNTTLIYVGKRFNNHRFSQTEINALLAEYAFKHNNVVRLKGGDPFVFGRGSEEVDYLENCGVEVEIIPGISSALAVPTNQGIPLTKRGVNESFWVITGTTSNGQISKDIIHGARSSATLVVLMGLRNFETIISEVLKHRSKNTPFAIIQNGTLKNETICIETLENHKNALSQIDYKAPGIIVIGDVVAEHHAFLEEEIQRVLEMY
ncbi:uroporphyrinogen-III C-methyltransferase [uncultured Polaribacter sp.]|uniref:uroporphyrinogen-III C-methyltransferase n=1 Tax=uncultured Polaribacter sp. TaxID=174711 RepID=UPI00262EF00F|nr:uroporphyrinogen-III C-methyltransferase [uncultured Polaribacter sp.]